MALSDFADLADAFVHKGDVTKPEHLRSVQEEDLAVAVASARTLVEKHGEHRAFVLV